MDKYFVFKLYKIDYTGYKLGIYNRDWEQWAHNIIFKGTLKECEDYKKLNNDKFENYFKNKKAKS